MSRDKWLRLLHTVEAPDPERDAEAHREAARHFEAEYEAAVHELVVSRRVTYSLASALEQAQDERDALTIALDRVRRLVEGMCECGHCDELAMKHQLSAALNGDTE